MPRVIRAPIRTRKQSSKPEAKNTTPFFESEIERNRQSPVPNNALGYGKEAFLQGSSKKHSNNVEGRRLKDEWTYGVTYYLP